MAGYKVTWDLLDIPNPDRVPGCGGRGSRLAEPGWTLVIMIEPEQFSERVPCKRDITKVVNDVAAAFKKEPTV